MCDSLNLYPAKCTRANFVRAQNSLSLSLSRMPLTIRRCAHLMKSYTGTRGTKLLYSRLTSSRTFVDVANGRHTRRACGVVLGIFWRSIYAGNFMHSTFSKHFDRPVIVHSIFTQQALHRCNALDQKQDGFCILKHTIHVLIHKKHEFYKTDNYCTILLTGIKVDSSNLSNSNSWILITENKKNLNLDILFLDFR